MNEILCIKYTYTVYNQQHFCYCENDAESTIWCEGAIRELSNYCYINNREMVKVTPDQFKEHHFNKIQQFTKKANEYENGE